MLSFCFLSAVVLHFDEFPNHFDAYYSLVPRPRCFGWGLGMRLCLLHAIHSGISSDEKAHAFVKTGSKGSWGCTVCVCVGMHLWSR